MGVDTPSAMLRRSKEFSIDESKGGTVLDMVHCPVLPAGSSAGGEVFSTAEAGALRIYNGLSKVAEAGKETSIPNNGPDGGLTAHVGAWPLLAQKWFEFLDKHFDMKRNGV